MNLTHAAATLHVHPNTLRYRLRRIRSAAAATPTRFGDLVDLICLLDLLEEAHDDPSAFGPDRDPSELDNPPIEDPEPAQPR